VLSGRTIEETMITEHPMTRTREAAHGNEVVGEIQHLLQRAVGPYRHPTSQEAGRQLPALARLLRQRVAAGRLSAREACAILGEGATRVLELRAREILSEALSHPASRRSLHEPKHRGWDLFGLTLDA
jgi:hypothetical protein